MGPQFPQNAEMPKDPDRGDLQARSVPDLIRLAVDQEREFGGLEDWPEPAWYAYQELQHRGTAEVFSAAVVALSAPEPVGRTVGADVLSQLRNQEGGTFVEQSVNALVAAAEVEQEPSVLRSIAFALGHRASPSGRRMLFSLAQHPSERVRFAVATGLWAVAIKDGDAVDDDPEAVSVHLDLMRDPDNEVRNWAAFGLGTQLSADTPAIRAALRERLDDPDEGTREEAVYGLAKRRDEVAFEPLLEYLRSGFAGTGCIDAAGAWGDLRFVDALAAIRETQPSVANSVAGALRVIREANQ